MTTRSPTGFAIVTLKNLALSPLVDDEPAFDHSFPEPVILVPIPTIDSDEEYKTPRHKATRARTQKFKPGKETVVDRPEVPSPRPIEAYYEAAIISLRSPMTTIGRASTNDIPIPTGTVSGRHGQFSRAPNGKWVYLDLGSTNGSLVRAKPVLRDMPLELDNGAEITVGSEVSVMFLTPAGLLNLARIVRAQLGGADDD